MASVQTKPLKGPSREAHLKKKWNRLWTHVRDRILRLPAKEQNILLEDFLTAIESRITVMERISNGQLGFGER